MDCAGNWIDRKMAAEVDDDPPISQNSELSSFRSFKQAGLDRRRPSKRQTTVRSFKIKTSWSSDASSTANTIVSSQKSSTDFPRTQELSTIAPSPVQLPLETSTTSNSRSPVPKHTAALDPEPQDTSSSSVVEWASPVNVLPDQIQMPIILRSRVPRESPSSIVLESPQAHLLQTDEAASVIKIPSPSQKTPLSGPGKLKAKRGRKRTKDDAESKTTEEEDSLENEYRENNFVRLFNADQGRKNSISEITDLDVILTAIEEEALDIRNEMRSSAGKQAIKEFFIQMRKSFSETIDIYKENHMLKADLRKAKSKVNKLRKELLSVQQKRTRISAKLESEKKKLQESSERQKVLEDFSSFLVKLEALHEECQRDPTSKKASKVDYGSFSNLPSLIIEGHGLLTAANQVNSINVTGQQRI